MAARMSEKAFGNERIYLDVLHVQACSSAEVQSVVESLRIHGVVFASPSWWTRSFRCIRSIAWTSDPGLVRIPHHLARTHLVGAIA